MFGRCPKCGSAEIGPDGRCELCGFPATLVNKAMLQMYLITGAHAASVFVYGLIAYVMVTGGRLNVRPGAVPVALGYGLVAVGVLAATAGYLVARRGAKPAAPRVLLRWLLIASALVEAAAILGLVATLISGNLQWIALLLAVSLGGFAAVGSEMPAYAHSLVTYAEKNYDDRE
ncbi:MAG: hypothetical protein J7M26_02220 [Armatimonadetes bacterium]|nr:hypothetical protein [Armatimonadota bacterium]